MIAVFLADVHDFAFQIGVKILEDGSGRLALEERLAIESDAIGFRRRKEFLGDGLLVAAENVQSRDAALDEAAEHAAVFAHCSHQKRRLERRLRDPGDGGSAESETVAGGEDVHPVGEEAQGFLFGFLVHITPERSEGIIRKRGKIGQRTQVTHF